MFDYHSLLERSYIEGVQDCYDLARRYYRGAWGINLPNVARPHNFWEDPSLDLYSRWSDHGFFQVMDVKLEVGDALLMPIYTSMNTHAAMIVDDNIILHHMPGALSRLDPLRPQWVNRAAVVLRHPKVTKISQSLQVVKPIQEVLDAAIFRDPKVAERIAQAMGS